MSTTINAGNATSGAAISADTTGILQLQSGSTPTTAVTIDASQNVGIGTASPQAKLVIEGGTSSDQFRMGTGANYYKIGRESVSTGYLNFYGTQSGANGYVFGGIDGERMRIDSSGNVGIGTSSPASKLNVNGSTNTNSGIYLQNQTTSIGIFSNEATWLGTGSSNNLAISSYGSNAFLFGTAGAERMRIDSSGNLLKGTTSVYSTAYGTGDISFYSANAGFVTLAPGAAGGGVPTIQIYLNAAGTAVGYIAVSTAATFFTSLSDYRVKKDIITMQGGLEKINKLKPVTYKLKADDSDGEGFIAHELQEIIPFAVIGKKDDVADNGEIKPQAIDQSKIVATLVLAVQELSAEVQSLKQQLGK